jgi:exosortase
MTLEVKDPPRHLLRSRPSALETWQRWVVGLVLGLLYWPTLAHLAVQWWTDPNFSHGILVPLFSAYLLWQRRKPLKALPLQPAWSGLAVLVLATAILAAGVLGAELFLARVSLLFALAGLATWFWGWNHLRAALFPWAFLFLMIPLPALVFNQLTLPLQLLAAKLAATILQAVGIPVLRDGNILHLPAMSLEVAEACSGIRSLLSLIALALIYGYWSDRRVGMRIALVAAAPPIAVVANAFRIVGTGVCVQYWSPDRAEGFFHAFSGWMIFLISFGLLLAAHRVLCRLSGQDPGTESRS